MLVIGVMEGDSTCPECILDNYVMISENEIMKLNEYIDYKGDYSGISADYIEYISNILFLDIQADKRLWRIRFSRTPRGLFCASGLCLKLAQMPFPCGLRSRFAQFAAHGVLCAGPDRAGCARTWRR